MGRAPCCDKGSVKKGPWSPEEDRKLREYIHSYGTGGNWIALPSKAGLRRCGKSCRLRWLNYLRPNIKHGGFSDEEDRVICSLFATIGSRWSVIAAQLPGRTDNDIKNYWNTKLKKKLHLLIAAAAAGGLPAHTPPPPAVAHPCGFSLEQHHHRATSASSPGLLVSGGSSSLYNGGLYFDISTDGGDDMIGNNSAVVGLESFVFGGLELQEQDTTQDHLQHHLFPAAAGNGMGHNVMVASDGLLLDHHQQRRYYGESSSSSYEHEPKPLMVSPSGDRRSSSFFYGDGEEASDGAVQLMERLAW